MKGILCAVILIGLASGQSRVPIPATPLGHVYKNVPASAQIHIEFFIDLLCPDSKAAFPVLKRVGDHYGNKVRISTIQFPLPYHRNAFLAATVSKRSLMKENVTCALLRENFSRKE